MAACPHQEAVEFGAQGKENFRYSLLYNVGMATFSKSEIQNGLKRLGELAEQRGFSIRLMLVGGAAMVLGFDARQSTRDVDAIILSPEEARLVRNLARQVADEYDWPEDWLNDGAKGYMVGLTQGPSLFRSPGIEVAAPSLPQLLAMKLCAWRDDIDIADARRLLQDIAPGQKSAEVWKEVEPFLVPGDELTAQYAFMDLWESLYGTD